VLWLMRQAGLPAPTPQAGQGAAGCATARSPCRCSGSNASTLFKQLRNPVRAFGRTDNHSWLIEHRGFCTPIEACEHLILQPAVA
jgi:hypothetical protein